MHVKTLMARGLVLASLAGGLPAWAGMALPDHQEFEAALQVPFRSAAVARPINLHFEYPGAAPGTPVAWEVALLGHDGRLLRRWQGQTTLQARTAQASVHWGGYDSQHRALAD